MVNKLPRVLASLSLATLTLFTTAGAVEAQPHQQTYPTEPLDVDSAYHVRVEFADGTAHDTVLMCPGGGEHPHGAHVCEQLTAVNGEISALTATDGVCLMDYRPVSVRAHGMWNDRFQSYQGQFPNHCVAIGYTGGYLFDIAPR
ncbi:MAG TPA: SSI family serine proteinase inhibitor [Glycomyces sp.]|nr:SSI family serine proteinase inhibitor [Glycomyces sp.]